MLCCVQNINIQTGEERIPPAEFWQGIVTKLQLTAPQVGTSEEGVAQATVVWHTCLQIVNLLL